MMIGNIKSFIRDGRFFFSDFCAYRRYSMGSDRNPRALSYRLMLSCHSIEKGLCFEEPRYFGEKKVRALLEVMQAGSTQITKYERDLGLSTLANWVKFCECVGATDKSLVKETRQYLESVSGGRPAVELCDSAVLVPSPHFDEKEISVFDEIISTRHSARKYDSRSVDLTVVADCVEAFIKAPSACNRQMCKLYWVKNSQARGYMFDNMAGLFGFDKENSQLFVVTYELASLEYAGERNQGYLNAGLAAMNFVNALHVRGVGSCFIEWAKKREAAAFLKQLCGIAEGEEIAVVIVAGYYKESQVAPASHRRPVNDVFAVVP